MITIFENFQFHVYFDMEKHRIRYCVGDKSISLTYVNIDITCERVINANEDNVDALAIIAAYHDNLQFCFNEAKDYDDFKQMLRQNVVVNAAELFDFSFKMKKKLESEAKYYKRLCEACKHDSVSCLDIVKQVAKYSHDDLSNKHASIYVFCDKSIYECTDSDDFFYNSIEEYHKELEQRREDIIREYDDYIHS